MLFCFISIFFGLTHLLLIITPFNYSYISKKYGCYNASSANILFLGSYLKILSSKSNAYSVQLSLLSSLIISVNFLGSSFLIYNYEISNLIS